MGPSPNIAGSVYRSKTIGAIAKEDQHDVEVIRIDHGSQSVSLLRPATAIIPQ